MCEILTVYCNHRSIIIFAINEVDHHPFGNRITLIKEQDKGLGKLIT